MSPENVQLQGRRVVIVNHSELTEKLILERSKILEFLLGGIRKFQKQGTGSKTLMQSTSPSASL